MTHTIPRRPPLAVSLALCVGLVGLMGWLRLEVFRQWVLPVGYGVPLVLAGWSRNRRVLWTVVVIFAAMTIWKFFFLLHVGSPAQRYQHQVEALAVVSFIVDLAVRRNQDLEERSEELRTTNEELAKSQRELDRRRQQAEEASIRKSRFLAAVSHDIRTPANAISLLAELIQRRAADPAAAGEVPELAQELQKSSAGLVNLVSDVLDLTRLDIGRMELNAVEFELGAWLEEECRELRPLAEEKKLAFHWSVPAQPLRVRCDRTKLSRVMMNLIGNAIKFTERGQVHVRAELLPDGRPHVSVQDTGVGIAPEDIERIFDEFFQLKQADRDRNKGTGLGLSICKRLVETMGGTLTVNSSPGRGSTFAVVLPASVVMAGAG